VKQSSTGAGVILSSLIPLGDLADLADALLGSGRAAKKRRRLEGRLRAARIRYVLALRPGHGTWQVVDDPAHPPAFTPAEAASRLPLERWRRLVLTGSHHRPLVRYVAELELGPCYGLPAAPA
jgi:hypothetical protein